MVKCERCKEHNECQPIILTADLLRNSGTKSIYLCDRCLFQLQMFIQIWIDESNKDSDFYRNYGER